MIKYIKEKIQELKQELTHLDNILDELFKTYDSWTLDDQEHYERMKDEEWEIEKEIIELEKEVNNERI